MKILAVDDDPLALAVLRAALNAGGYTEMTLAEGAADALQIIETIDFSFDCFLLDIMMPEIDGVELCTRIRAMEGHLNTPIVMITALKDQVSIDRAYRAGATDFVTKPFNGLELGARIRAADILSAQVNHHKQFETIALQWRAQLDQLNALALEDSFVLQGFDGAVDTLAQENILMKSPDAGFSGSLMAVRICNVAAVFENLSVTEFRAFITDSGAVFAKAIGLRGALIAYEGNGHFLAMAPRPITKVKADYIIAEMTPVVAASATASGFSGVAQILGGDPKPFNTQTIETRLKSINTARKSAVLKEMAAKADKAVATLRPKAESIGSVLPSALTVLGDVAHLMTRPKAFGRPR